MPHRRVLITDHPWPGIDIEQEILSPYGIELVDAPAEDEATLSKLAEDVVAIATCWAKVTPQVIKAAKECRIICRMGIGLDNIAIPTATQKGILVTNVPDYCVEEVADHAIGLILGLARDIGFYHWQTKQGIYNLKAGPTMHRLRGRTLGLVGFGRIARAVYERATAFGLNVIASTPSGNDYGTGCKMVSLEELLTSSNIISLHSPLNDETRHLLNNQTFQQLKPGTYIINTSRGPLIDHDALLKAIQSGQVAGAGLDVFEPEPPDLSHPLYQQQQVIATPHAAFVSEESLIDLRVCVAKQIKAVLLGETPVNVVNPEVLKI